jgi:hypothetical protein
MARRPRECATIRARMAPDQAIDYSTTIGMWKFSQAGVVFNRFWGWFHK